MLSGLKIDIYTPGASPKVEARVQYYTNENDRVHYLFCLFLGKTVLEKGKSPLVYKTDMGTHANKVFLEMLTENEGIEYCE